MRKHIAMLTPLIPALILVLLGCLGLAMSAQGASFDCGKAGTRVEHLICDNPEISKLDDELSVAYKAALKDEKQTEAIKQAQKQWMKIRNACVEAACVKQSYEERLRELTKHMLDETPTDSNGEVEFISASIDMDRSGRHFELIRGKGVKVCEIYKNNLEALGNPNLACERRVSTEYEGIIKLPVWRKLVFFDNRYLWAQVEKLVHVGLYRPERMASKDTAMDDPRQIDILARRYQEHAERYQEEVYKQNVASIDVDNDGNNEVVLRANNGLCGESVRYHSIALFVLNEKGDAVDLQKSRPLLQDSRYERWSKEVQQNGVVGNGSMYDVFIFKEDTFIDRWTWTGIWIYKISNSNAEVICHFN